MENFIKRQKVFFDDIKEIISELLFFHVAED